jgi:hypothetical protein
MRQFRALRFVAGFYRVLAWIVLILGIIGGIAAIVFGATGGAIRIPGVGLPPDATGTVGGVISGLLIILGALLYFVLLYAMSDIFLLGIAIEHNTRETVNYLREDIEAYPSSRPTQWEPPPPPPPPAH